MDVYKYLIKDLWHKQKQYNKRIREREGNDNKEYWSKQYILGIVSELDEVLHQIHWKLHRKEGSYDRYNLGRELADVTKYVWSLWELHGFSYSDMLEFVHEKTKELETQWMQDFVWELPEDCPVIITDLDGTLGDWRKAFINWLQTNSDRPDNMVPEDSGKNMSIEIDLGISYGEYYKLKEKFEAEGGYRYMSVYADVLPFFGKISRLNPRVIAYTARPADRYSRIWSDSYNWIKDNHIPIDELYIGSEQRILRALQLKEKGHLVVMLEDDPTLALRAACSGVDVVLRKQHYNGGIDHPRICPVGNLEYSLHFINQILTIPERKNKNA